MCETETLQRIDRVARHLPESAARRVLAFAEYLQIHNAPEPKFMLPEDEAALIAELRARAETRPMQTETSGEFMRKLRDEARY